MIPSTIMYRSFVRTIQFVPIGLALCLARPANAQLTVAPQSDLQALATTIAGTGVSISNPVITCHTDGYGTFTSTGTNLDLSEGVLLTSGTINNAIGPNNAANKTFQAGTSGNALLDVVTGRSTRDACLFEFDIIPSGDSLRFNFELASEEYNEWVGSQYNDVFGFFISGPGISGDPGIGNEHNIAVIPGTNQAVTINNVNNGSNPGYYYDNAGGPHIQYDGITRGLYAESAVQPCQQYHLKLVVADASDRKFDSGVFIEKIHSNQVTMAKYTANGSPSMIEGCNPGWVQFIRQTALPTPLVLTYHLGGTATNGADYNSIGDPDPNVPKTVTIPANQTTVLVNVDPIADGINEPTEDLVFILGNPLCAWMNLDSLTFEITDTLLATLAPTNATLCRGDSVLLTASAAESHAWSPSTGLSSTSSASVWAKPTSTTTYSVVVTDGDCSSILSSQIRVSDMQLSATGTRPLCSGQSNGAINLSVSNGVAPYSFSWTGPNGFTAATEDLVNIGAGTYSVTVTDAAGCSRTHSASVAAPAPLTGSLSPSIQPFGENIACHGGTTGTLSLSLNGGTAPYAVQWSGPDGYGSTDQNISGLRAGTYSVVVTDAHGCTFTGAFTMTEPTAIVPLIDGVTHVACFGANNGQATASATGGLQPYSYSWNTTPVQNTTTANSLVPGSHTVTVRDGYLCTSTATVTITGPATALSSSLTASTPVSCHGGQNGSATVSASGGTAPYSFSWNTIPVQNTATATGLPAGTWICIVSDANGCATERQVTISQPGAPLTSSIGSQSNVDCHGTATGRATISVSGGTAPYTFSWNTNPIQTGSTATGLTAGTWICTVSDARGCSTLQDVVITEPSAPLHVAINAQTDVACHGGSIGSATVTASGGTGPYTYIWNTLPAQYSATASNLAAGTWTCTVFDARECQTQITVTITQPAAALGVTIPTPVHVLCHGAQTGSVEAVAIGGTAPYTYEWNSSPQQQTAQATDLPAGSFTVLVTDARNCTASASATITEPAAEVTAVFSSVTHESCYQAQDGTATITVSGGSGSYNIVWDTNPVVTGPTATNLGAGLYMVAVTDVNGCDHTKHYPVTIIGAAAPLTVSAVATDVSCYALDNGAIDLTLTGGHQPYSILWTGPGGQETGLEDIDGLAPGEYDLHILDFYGCAKDTTISITEPDALEVTGDITTAACQGSATGAVDITPTGGTQPYTYSWSGPNGYTANTADVSALGAGAYVLTLSDGNGCTITEVFNVSQPGSLQLTATSTVHPGGWGVSCASASDGSIDLTVSGGTGPFTFTWTGPNGYTASTEDVNGLLAGNYHVSADDANGCTATLTQTIIAPATLTATAMPSNFNGYGIHCSGAADGSLNATISGGTGPYVIQWNGPNGFASSDEDITGLAPGTYTLFATDLNGCTVTLTRTLTEPPTLVATITTSTTIGGTAIACSGATTGTAQISVNGGIGPYAIQWSGPNGFSASAIALSGLAAGTYDAVITDANGCSMSTQAILDEPAQLEISGIVSDHNGHAISCANNADGSIDLTLNGGAGANTIQWSGTNGFVSNTEDLNGLAAATYSVIVSDQNGCSAIATFDLSAPAPLIGTATSGAITCASVDDGSIDLTVQGGTGPFAIQWTGPNGFNASTEDLGGLAPGTYSANLNDQNGCSTDVLVALTGPAPLTLTYTTSIHASGDQVACAGGTDGSIDLSVLGGTGAHDISWSNGSGFSATSEDISGLDPGTYQVVVSDENGCTALTSVQLTAPQPLGVSATLSMINGNNVTCQGAMDGSIDLTITGGAAPYIAVWNDGTISEDRVDLGAGIHSVQITDANGCTASGTYTLTAPETVMVSVTATAVGNGMNITCPGGTDGGLEATLQGGTGPYTIAWTGPNGYNANTASISGLGAGSYTLNVSDANGCTHLSTTVLAEPAALTLDLASTTYNGGYNIPCATIGIGVFNTTVSGGTPSYTYAWSGPNGFTSDLEDLTSLVAGQYDLVVTDAFGCTQTASATLTAPDALDVVITFTEFNGNQVSCAGNDGGISVSINGGTPSYQFEWTGPNGFSSVQEDLTALAAGSYALTVTDANGCRNDSLLQLNAPEPLHATFQNTPNQCSDASNGSIDLTLSGGGAPYTMAWTGPDGFVSNAEDLSGLANGSYTVLISDGMGCTGGFSTVLDGPQPLTAGAYTSYYGLYNLQCQGDSTGVINLGPTGGNAPYSIAISGPNGFQSTQANNIALIAGTYQITLTDAIGCTADTTITLTEPSNGVSANLTLSLYPSGTNVSCFGASDGAIDATINGGNGPYTYSWRGPDDMEFTTEDITGLPAGDYNYELVVTDANNCSFFTEVTLTQPDSALSTTTTTALYNGQGTSCHGVSDGSIDLTISGGNGGYSQTWAGPDGFTSTLEDIDALAAGTYVGTATDMNGCSSVATVVITTPDPLTPNLNTSNFPGGSQISCANATDGSIETIVTGGSQPFTYSWSGPNGTNSTNPMITGLGPGTYCVTITDANGCQATDCSTLQEPSALIATTTATSSACAGDNGSVDLNVNGGSAPFQFEWDNGATTEDLDGLPPGVLNVTVTDANGCTADVTATIIGSPALNVQAQVSGEPCHGDSTGAVDLSVISGTAPYVFQWSHGANTEDISDLPAGTYSATITDASGCTFQGTYLVQEPAAITIDTLISSHASGHPISSFGAQDGSIATVVSGGTGPYTFNWSNGANTESIQGLAAGTYTLTVTDENGCLAQLMVLLTEPTDLEMPTAFSPNGDGDNERFVIHGIEGYPKNQLTILNRWGNKVYERPDYRNEWSGENSQGSALPNGTYFVILSINDGSRTLQGYVDLRR